MPFIAYLDESGDHSLELIDKDFPLFVLVFCVVDLNVYINAIVPDIYRLKFDYFGHEGIIFHSRDIRKASGDFTFLTIPAKRSLFIDRMNQIMSKNDYMLIATVIRKQAHKERYGQNADNPYDLALKFAMERLLAFLEQQGQDNLQIIAEARGRREDNSLELTFRRIIDEGTEYNPAARFKKINFNLTFKKKEANIIGTQLADLAAYPIARYISNPAKPNPAYDIVKTKLYKSGGVIKGLKVFP